MLTIMSSIFNPSTTIYFFKAAHLMDWEGKYWRLFSSIDLIWRSDRHRSTAILCAVIFLLSRVVLNKSKLYSSLSIDISSKKSPHYEGKYSLKNIYTISVDCEIMMKYLCQLMMTKKVVLNDFLKKPSEVFTVIFNEACQKQSCK